MIPLATATHIAAKLLVGPVQDLNEINAQLRAQNKPDYWLGGAGFNVEYRIANQPRYVWRWWPPDLVLSEFYLYHLPSVPEGRAPDLRDEIVIQLR